MKYLKYVVTFLIIITFPIWIFPVAFLHMFTDFFEEMHDWIWNR